ncbi:phosphonate ABC transporter substrate-binding protein [Thioflexithrix psekupsensis]|uniref:Phosphonate ABC transporter substrate-binding protein n=1 Tax=Thioflexithrix psekupsensis TaxID=1570016 RepID=A0A251XC53_9GAMM|nr:phosphonate ABC transporter substrate-binding protein [Thioflexithrix psekupsensis]OUD16234.1 phosphonate ABC transporter substrate-binding protein [Thioflexithrix psekupsensis]
MMRHYLIFHGLFLFLFSFSFVAWADMPEKLVLGSIPNESPENLKKHYAPLLAYLEKTLNLPVELSTPSDYDGVVVGMKAKNIDVAYYGPKSYVKAAEEAGAVAFARILNADGAEGYHSLIITLKSSGLTTLADLKGKTWLYADPDSTSGTLVPRAYFYLDARIDPDTYFSKTGYSGGPEKSILALKNKEVDAIAASGIVLHRGGGEAWTMDDFNVIWQSELIPNSLFAYRNDLPEALKQALTEAFLNFRDPEGLSSLKITGLVPAKDEDYDFIRKLYEYEKRMDARRQK